MSRHPYKYTNIPLKFLTHFKESGWNHFRIWKYIFLTRRGSQIFDPIFRGSIFIKKTCNQRIYIITNLQQSYLHAINDLLNVFWGIFFSFATPMTYMPCTDNVFRSSRNSGAMFVIFFTEIKILECISSQFMEIITSEDEDEQNFAETLHIAKQRSPLRGQ